jgi:hypothetical protein
VHVKSHQCFHCGFTLDPLTLDPADFDRLKAAFLDRALVGGDIFEKTTPQEFDKFLAFLNRTTPYDIVMDGLNVSHVGGELDSLKFTNLLLGPDRPRGPKTSIIHPSPEFSVLGEFELKFIAENERRNYFTLNQINSFKKLF